MKRLLVLMLVLTIPSFANAGLINVVTDGVGSMGHAGTIHDPLWTGEIIQIKISLADGHTSDGYDLDLHVTGPGTLQEVNGGPNVNHQVGMGMWMYSGIEGNSIARMSEITFGAFTGDLVWGLQIHCDGPGEVTLDLGLNDLRITKVDGEIVWPDGLGDLTIYQVPEPMTAVLLALGGLALLRRRK